jgi:hypothetical protein
MIGTKKLPIAQPVPRSSIAPKGFRFPVTLLVQAINRAVPTMLIMPAAPSQNDAASTVSQSSSVVTDSAMSSATPAATVAMILTIVTARASPEADR